MTFKKNELGTIVDFKVKPETIPKFCKALSVPFAIKEAIERKLNRLKAAGIMERVTHSDWDAPIVAVPKNDGGFCICGDYKVTVNEALDGYQYPLPNSSELFAALVGGKKFTTSLITGLSATSGVNQVCQSHYS